MSPKAYRKAERLSSESRVARATREQSPTKSRPTITKMLCHLLHMLNLSQASLFVCIFHFQRTSQSFLFLSRVYSQFLFNPTFPRKPSSLYIVLLLRVCQAFMCADRPRRQRRRSSVLRDSVVLDNAGLPPSSLDSQADQNLRFDLLCRILS